MKTKTFTKFAFLLLLFALGTNRVSAQHILGKEVVDAEFELSDYSYSAKSTFINYSLGFSGLVEFELYDSKGKMVWKNQYNQKEGDNYIRLNTSRFDQNENYSFTLKFKTTHLREILPVSYASR